MILDGFSVVGSESVLSLSSPRDLNQKDNFDNSTRNEDLKAPQASGNGGGEVSVMQQQQQQQERSNCGILQNTCLPCLASTVPSIEKKKSLSPSGTPSSRRKPSLKLSFKWREGNATPTLCEFFTFFLRSLQLFFPCMQLFVCMLRLIKFEMRQLLIYFQCAFLVL